MVEFILQKTKEETSLLTKKMYVSTPYNRVQAVEERLKKIFEEELHSEGSILVSYRPEILSKLAKYLSGHVSRSASIGIAGETASGKSTITKDLIDTIEYTIPEGTQSGKMFYVRGRGIRTARGTGDLYVEVIVETPIKLSKAQRKALEAFEKDSEPKQTPMMREYNDNLDKYYGK